MTDVKVEAHSPPPGPHVAALLGAVFETIRSDLASQDWGGLRPSHFRLLEAIPAAGTTSTELAPVLRMTKQAVGQFVTQLVGSGHLRIDVDAADRRRRAVRRTRLGDRTVAEVRVQMQALEQRWADVIGAERYREFRSVLEQLAGEHLATRS
jgi:DNA-binding MarR family transcriptional regulator